MSDTPHEDAGVGGYGSSADFAQPTPDYADETTGYPEADLEYTGSINEPAEGGEDPRPEKTKPDS